MQDNLTVQIVPIWLHYNVDEPAYWRWKVKANQLTYESQVHLTQIGWCRLEILLAKWKGIRHQGTPSNYQNITGTKIMFYLQFVRSIPVIL